jgi:lipopolysaccharide export system protein LptA
MQKTVRILRIVLPILFLGFVALIAVSYTATSRRAPSGMGAGERSVRQGDRPALVSYTFEDTQSIGGRIVSRIRARRTTGFRSGWYALEDAHLTVYRKEGGTYELVAPLAQFNAQSKHAEISGGVRVSSSDGMEIRTQEVKFDGNRILNRIPVEFRVHQWRGKAGGVDLDVTNDRLRLFESVTAQMKPASAAEVPMTVTAAEATFIRKFGEVKFEGNTTVTRGADRLQCGWIQALFDDTGEILIELKGEGSVVVTFSSGSTIGAGSASDGEKRLEADRFFCELGPLGEIRAVNALGENGPARAFFAGPPQRRFTAPWLRLALEASSLRELKADNGVVLEEAGPKGPRILRASQMYVYFDPATRRATSSLIQGNVEYRDSEVTASAERANYDIVGDRMVLTPVSGSQVTIVAQKNTIRASLIELSPRDQSMKASGHVAATLVSGGGGGAASAGETSLFPSGAPVYVNADSGVFRQGNRTAVFQGNVRAWQELNTLLAKELTVRGAGDTVNARGSVKMVLYNARGNEPTPGAATRTPVVATSEALAAKKAERRVELTGNVRIEEMTRLLTTDKATLLFSAAKRLERVDADGKVRIADRSVGRNGSGEKGVYRVSEQMFYLDGRPAELTDPRGVLRGQQIAYDISKNKAVVSSGTAPSESTYKPE